MKVLVVGGGGREHALIRKIKESSKVDEIFCTPGNGGISYDAKCFDVSATDIDGVVDLAKKLSVDLVVVAPDDPLVAGMVDALNDAGFKTFGGPGLHPHHHGGGAGTDTGIKYAPARLCLPQGRAGGDCPKRALPFLDKRLAVCRAHNWFAMGEPIPHLQTEKNFRPGTRPGRKWIAFDLPPAGGKFCETIRR